MRRNGRGTIFPRNLLPRAVKRGIRGRRIFTIPMIPITERFLSECGGWQALQARRAASTPRAACCEASYAPPLLEGRVREGEGELRSGLRITSTSHVENLCDCRAARRDGMICAHALAVGLEWLKPHAPAGGSTVGRGGGGCDGAGIQHGRGRDPGTACRAAAELCGSVGAQCDDAGLGGWDGWPAAADFRTGSREALPRFAGG